MPKLRDSPCSSTVLTAGQWSGEPCFVIGGGPSLEGFDFDRLKGFHSIGANMAVLKHPDIAYFIDYRAVELIRDREEWLSYKGIALLHPTIAGHKHAGDRVFDVNTCVLNHIAKRERKREWPKSFEQGVIGMNNTGVMCVQIADLLGASPIFLLGFDMGGGVALDGRSKNWHEEYPKKWGAIGRQVYPRFVRSFLKVNEHAKGEIFNCSPKSRMNYFPKITIDAAFEILEARSHEQKIAESPHSCPVAAIAE